MKPQQIVTKLTAHIADLKAKQVAALAASEAEGVSAEDRAKHLADFDQLQKDKEAAQANLGRAQAMVREEEQAGEAAVTPEREPIVTKPFVPAAQAPDFGAGKPRIPANVRRGGALKAFKGEDAELRAYQTGLWVAATMYNHKPSLERLADFGDALKPQATLSTTSNSGAGYFVPDVMTTAIIELQEEYGVIRRFADIEQMSSETWKGPRWSTGMVAYWVSQGNAPTQSEPGWDQVELVAKDLAAFGKMSAQLNEDALISVGDKWAAAWGGGDCGAGCLGDDGVGAFRNANRVLDCVQVDILCSRREVLEQRLDASRASGCERHSRPLQQLNALVARG